jgi:hypothetical protein
MSSLRESRMLSLLFVIKHHLQLMDFGDVRSFWHHVKSLLNTVGKDAGYLWSKSWLCGRRRIEEDGCSLENRNCASVLTTRGHSLIPSSMSSNPRISTHQTALRHSSYYEQFCCCRPKLHCCNFDHAPCLPTNARTPSTNPSGFSSAI